MTIFLKGISSMATRHILADLAASYEATGEFRIEIVSVGGVNAARRVRSGEPFDLVILASDAAARLEDDGHLVAGSRRAFARAHLAMAVRAKAARPPFDDEEAVKQAVLSAKAVCYSTGPSGDHLKRLWVRWGIADIVSATAIQASPGVPVAALLARGSADLGFQQLSEFLGEPGIDILCPLPPAVDVVTLFQVGMARTCSRREEACFLIDHLTSSDGAAAKRKRGMEPP